MEIKVLGSFGGQSPGLRLTSLLVNGSIALDAGSLSQALEIEEQVLVRSIVLTHSHMDHISSLPFFVENVFGQGAGIDIYASAETVYAIRKYLFNNSTWPDFTRIPNHLLPAMRFTEIEDNVPFTVDGVTFTPFPVDHIVPTFGFLIEQGDSAILWSSDTGPTTRLWELANSARNVKAVCIDTSFDNALQRVADLSLHLTPRTLEAELQKLSRPLPLLVHHLKPACAKRIREEIRALKRPDLEYLEQGRVYKF
jgi:ribonuclease BN (tRNA processing enzyme)